MITALKSYAVGFAALLLAVMLRWALDPTLGNTLPFVTLWGAVAAAVWLNGYRLAIPIALLGYFACHYFFIPPRGSFDLTDMANVVGLVAYLFTCSIIIVFGELARMAHSRATASREVFRVTLKSIGDGDPRWSGAPTTPSASCCSGRR